jgi:predicted amidophosphoribosyltransferase
VALGVYEGPLRGVVLAYKDRGRHRLAPALGAQLARGVAAITARLGGPSGTGWLGGPSGTGLVIVPVPSSPAAIRERHGDHMQRLAQHCVRTLTGFGWSAGLARPATAQPKADSAHLDAASRAAAARDAFRPRTRPAGRLARAAAAGARVVLIDDVITTGATLAALTSQLAAVGIPVFGAVTLAATQRRMPPRRT